MSHISMVDLTTFRTPKTLRIWHRHTKEVRSYNPSTHWLARITMLLEDRIRNREAGIILGRFGWMVLLWKR